MTITNSTISDNSTGGDGGGINNSAGKITINNSTISGNRAGVDGSGDGGGIRNSNFSSDYSVNIRNTIIADNFWGDSAYGLIPTDFRGNLYSLGFNLIETAGGNPIIGDTTGNIIGQDPMLDPNLAYNGGPTSTHALLSGSPAINAGNNDNAPSTDQRGFARIIGGTIDIGAYEFAPVKSKKRVRFF